MADIKYPMRYVWTF